MRTPLPGTSIQGKGTIIEIRETRVAVKEDRLFFYSLNSIRALRGHIDTEKTKIFRSPLRFNSRIGPANRAVAFFTAQCTAAREAVDVWCLMAVRINSKVNRDIRKKIGMIIWESREQADYAVAQSADATEKSSNRK